LPGAGPTVNVAARAAEGAVKRIKRKAAIRQSVLELALRIVFFVITFYSFDDNDPPARNV
jgi:hypothetical protein